MNTRLFFMAAFSAVCITSALGSGSSPMHPPRAPRDAEGSRTGSTADSKYAIGKSVFTGKARLVDNRSARKSQRARLENLAARTGRSGANLPSLAGKLSEDQLDALEYYVSRRFGRN
jgi:hypothetical protein